jgi:hypothetical protein
MGARGVCVEWGGLNGWQISSSVCGVASKDWSGGVHCPDKLSLYNINHTIYVVSRRRSVKCGGVAVEWGGVNCVESSFGVCGVGVSKASL